MPTNETDPNALTDLERSIRETYRMISCSGSRADYRRQVEQKHKGEIRPGLVFECSW
jgi:hypothetical protein